MAGGNSGSSSGIGSATKGSIHLDSMNLEKQNRHIPGTKEFDETKSSFNMSASDLDSLIRNNIDKAEELSSGKMELELPKNVGTWVSKDGAQKEETNRVTLHNSKTGYHAVPARRKDKKGGKK